MRCSTVSCGSFRCSQERQWSRSTCVVGDESSVEQDRHMVSTWSRSSLFNGDIHRPLRCQGHRPHRCTLFASTTASVTDDGAHDISYTRTT